jgi:hypothetical protein
MGDKIIVCATGYTPKQKIEIQRRVEALGGFFESDLTREVNVLVANKTFTQKYFVSVKELKIPVVSRKWVDHSYSQRKFVKNYKQYMIPVFKGLKILLYHLESEFSKIIRKHGGIPRKIISSSCSLILTNPEHYQLLKYSNPTHLPVLDSRWVDDCIKQKVCLAPDDYRYQTDILGPADSDLFLRPCIIHFNGIENENIYREMVNLGGGTYSLLNLPCVTHIISNKYISSNTAYVVTPEWLKQSCVARKLLPAEGFKP